MLMLRDNLRRLPSSVSPGGNGSTFSGDGVSSSVVLILTAPSAVTASRTLDDRFIGSFVFGGAMGADVGGFDSACSSFFSVISAKLRFRALLPGLRGID